VAAERGVPRCTERGHVLDLTGEIAGQVFVFEVRVHA
jgi:hypothetical protein